jgi:hypothetical protein
MLEAIKKDLRITHIELDEVIQSDIDACLKDLEVCGVIHAPKDDPLIYNAIKLWCRAAYTDDTSRGSEYLRRYDALKSSLMMAGGYGREVAADE